MKILRILSLVLGLAVLANAQTAVLSGTVLDANGALITEAKITALNVKLEKFEAKTDSDGIYKLELPYKIYDQKDSFRIAKYILTVESPGFETFVLKGLNFVPSTMGKMSLDFALNVRVSVNTIEINSGRKKNKTKRKNNNNK
jgi:hypothetical protein